MKNSHQEMPKLLILMGHPRSGTTILNHICSAHPDIEMTREFSNMFLPQSYLKHVIGIRKDFLKKNPIIYAPTSFRKMRLLSILFFFRYLFWLLVNSRGDVTVKAMQKTLHRLYPEAKLVGDKKPTYLMKLNHFSQEDTYYVLIFRDGRDVVQSALNRSWSGKQKRFSSAKKTAKSWVRAAKIMEEHRDKFHIIRYENLVTNPREELDRLAEELEVDPAGFKPEMIKTGSIGKYKDSLTAEQISDVIAIAGPTLKRNGYELE